MTCNDPEMWVERSLRFRIWKRYADITFGLPNALIEKLATVTGRLNSTYIPAHSYLTFYDHVFPDQFRPDSTGLTLLSLFTVSIYKPVGKWLQTLSNLPWRIQLLQDFDGLNVPDENLIKRNYMPNGWSDQARLEISVDFPRLHQRPLHMVHFSPSPIRSYQEATVGTIFRTRFGNEVNYVWRDRRENPIQSAGAASKSFDM
jgi:hypothetical protein